MNATLNTREEKIVAAVDATMDDLIGFAGRLVAARSTLGQEAAVVRVMEKELAHLGFEPQRVPIDPVALAGHPGFAPTPWSYAGRENVVAVKAAAGQTGRSVLFNGHLDVVSPEPLSLWRTDPFTPLVKDGWLYGRGAGDMKAGVAAMVYAVQAVEKAGFGLGAPVTISGVIEEECSGNGALATVLAGYDADAVLIPEPFGPTLYVAQMGVLWFKVRVQGVPVHVQEATAGTNAIEKSFLLVAALRRLEEELNREDRPEPYRLLTHPVNLNIGIIQGGDWPSTVPAEAVFHGRLSFFPEISHRDMQDRLTSCLDHAVRQDPWLARNPPEIEFYGFRSDGHFIERNQPLMTILNQCHQTLTGRPAEEYVSTCTTDLRAFHFFGQGRGTCFGPTAENIHGANERVNLASVGHVARIYALFLARWCGLMD